MPATRGGSDRRKGRSNWVTPEEIALALSDPGQYSQRSVSEEEFIPRSHAALRSAAYGPFARVQVLRSLAGEAARIQDPRTEEFNGLVREELSTIEEQWTRAINSPIKDTYGLVATWGQLYAQEAARSPAHRGDLTERRRGVEALFAHLHRAVLPRYRNERLASELGMGSMREMVGSVAGSPRLFDSERQVVAMPRYVAMLRVEEQHQHDRGRWQDERRLPPSLAKKPAARPFESLLHLISATPWREADADAGKRVVAIVAGVVTAESDLHIPGVEHPFVSIRPLSEENKLLINLPALAKAAAQQLLAESPAAPGRPALSDSQAHASAPRPRGGRPAFRPLSLDSNGTKGRVI